MKTITFSLNPASIDRAIQEVKQYKADLKSKCEKLRIMVAERIKWTAQNGFDTAMVSDTFLRISGKDKSPEQPIVGSSVKVEVKNEGNISVVFAEGDQAVFIEYGAGVYHNGVAGDSPHPWGIEQGFAIGTYGQGKGVRNAWGYDDGNGVVLTHGTPAAMPMYRGAEEAVRAIGEMAREVFAD